MQLIRKKKLQASDSHWFLFILAPFFAGLTALRSYRSPWAKNVVWAFVVFYGFSFAVGKENFDADIVRYIDELKELYGKPIVFSDIVAMFNESGEADILRTLIAVVLSRFTDSSAVLTAVYGFIFGFFFSRCLWYMMERFTGKMKGITAFFLVAFFLVNPFWNINGFRFNTAALVFIYGAMPYLYENNKKKLIVCFASVLVHFSFLFVLAVFTIYLIAGNRKNAYFIFFIVSVFTSNININQFNEFLEQNLPEVFLERSKNYREEDRVQEFRESERDLAIQTDTGLVVKKNWYAVFYLRLLYWSLNALLIALFIFGKRVFAGSNWMLRGYCFSLLMFAAANIMQSLPSGERYLMIAALMSLSVIIFYLQNQPYEKYISKLAFILVPALLIFMIVALRTGLYSISLTTILGNPILAIFTDYNLSLNDIIK